MGRLQRFIPENQDGVLVEVGCRTHGARSLLVPPRDPRPFNEVLGGVLGRALEISPLEVCAWVVTSNHHHALLVVRSQQDLSRFMHHLQCNLSKEVGRFRRQWSGSLWSRRYDGIVVSSEPEVQWNRLRYLLRHGVKEGLVESPLDWPGIHAAKQLVHGEPLEGVWLNRTKEWAARNRGVEYDKYDFATRYQVGFSPLPAFRHLTAEAYQDRIVELVREIEEEGRQSRDGNPVAGVEKILGQNPYEPPTRTTKRSPKPQFHVQGREQRKELFAEFLEYLTKYREASEALRAGRKLEAATWFPEGCYPPALPFVGEPAPRRPPSPPTRWIDSESGSAVRGEIPVVELAVPVWSIGIEAPRARGQPP